MLRYTISRLVQSLLLMTGISFAVYVLIGLMPGDPVDLLLSGNPDVTSEDVARIRALYGLDRPLYERWWDWLLAALQGDFGYSRQFSQPVLEVIGPRLVNTLLLLGISLVLTVLIAVPLAVYAAQRPGGWIDGFVSLFSFAGISVPPFWLALMLIMLFAVVLGWLPAGGMGAPGDGLWGQLRHLALPVAALTLASVGGYIRFVRAAMIEAMRMDHIRTARMKGLSERAVLWRHGLGQALVPLVTILALDLGTLFSGALVIETMFQWLGMGELIYRAILANDYNLALMALMIATAFILAGNYLADIAYAALDPRIRIREAGQ